MLSKINCKNLYSGSTQALIKSDGRLVIHFQTRERLLPSLIFQAFFIRGSQQICPRNCDVLKLMKPFLLFAALVPFLSAAPDWASKRAIINGYVGPDRPFYVDVLYKGNQSCGGTIIHPFFVLSAAHCFSDGESFLRQVAMEIY